MPTVSEVTELAHKGLLQWSVVGSDNPTDVELPSFNVRLRSLTGATQRFAEATETSPFAKEDKPVLSTAVERLELEERPGVMLRIETRNVLTPGLWHVWLGLHKYSTTEPNRFDWAREMTKGLLENLVEAPSEKINVLFDALRLISSPEDILDIALEDYSRTYRDRYLTIAVSLLQERGSKAWPALRRLAGSNHPECELFVKLIATCTGVSAKDRGDALLKLSRHPDRAVRFQLLENLGSIDIQWQRAIVDSLANDKDNEIRREASEYLRFLEDQSA